MKRSSKISASAIFLTALVVGLVLLGLWISLLRPPASLSFDFLKGRAVVAGMDYDPRKSPFASIHDYYSRVRYYSFEADFSDVCKAADGELLALGFSARTHSIEGCKYRTYMLNEAASGQTIIIFGRQRFVVSASAQLPKPSSAEAYGRERRDGWVTVKISQGQLPVWPPRYLLYRLKRCFQAAANGNSKGAFLDFSVFCNGNACFSSILLNARVVQIDGCLLRL